MSAQQFEDSLAGVRQALGFLSLLSALGYFGLMQRPVSALRTAIKSDALGALVPVPLLGVGALLFVFSDAVIAVDKFRVAVPWRGPVIWSAYYAGQVLLVSSLLGLLR